ncbi:MAG TPA: hypothetical protein VGR10_01645 [Thermoleophilaceae bacterium]|nr:hypothetical protein [Thermoleophilaceae bacterium]
MMGMDMGLMAIIMVVVALIAVAGLLAVVYVGGRALRPSRDRQIEDSARALLDRRLAAGEISSEEYYERESALRSAQPSRPARRRRS